MADRQEQQQPAGTRRQFSAEFKREAVRLAAAGDRSLAQVARELGANPAALRSWKRRVHERAGAAPREVFPGNGSLPSQDEEVRRLRREVAQLREERDILKKRR